MQKGVLKALIYFLQSNIVIKISSLLVLLAFFGQKQHRNKIRCFSKNCNGKRKVLIETAYHAASVTGKEKVSYRNVPKLKTKVSVAI